MRRKVLLIACVLAVAVSAPSTQAPQAIPRDPFTAMGGGVFRDGGWLPHDNPVVMTGVRPAVQAPDVPAPDAEACGWISPYTDRPGCIVGDYRIGQTYQFGLSRGLVIGLSMASTGAEVVTVQYLYDLPDAPLQVWAFLNDGRQRPWEWRR